MKMNELHSLDVLKAKLYNSGKDVIILGVDNVDRVDWLIRESLVNLINLSTSLLLQVHYFFNQLDCAWYIGKRGSNEVRGIVKWRICGSDTTDRSIQVIKTFLLYLVSDF